MFLSATTIGPDPTPSPHRSGRIESGNNLYRAVALTTIFAMLFGGLLLMPRAASAADAVSTDRVNLRSEPTTESDVLTVIPEGESVSVDGDAQGGFYPVTWNGTTGYAAVDFIQFGGGGGGNEPNEVVSHNAVVESSTVTNIATNNAEPEVTSGAPVGTAWVTTDRLNFRSTPDANSDVLDVLTNGTAVELTGQQSNGFWQANARGMTGWLFADYVTTSGPPAAPSADDPVEVETATTEDDPADMEASTTADTTMAAQGATGGSGTVPVGEGVTGSATVTANLNMRQGPGTDYGVVTVLPSGASVELRGDPQGEFYPLAYNGSTGWGHANWLSIGGSAPEADPDPAPDPEPAPSGGTVPVGESVTGSATVTANLNMRQGPDTGYGVVVVIPSGASVELRGEPQGEFYPVGYNGSTGWAHGNWISLGGSTTDPDPAPDPAPGDDDSVPVGGSVTGSATVTANLNMRQGPSTDYGVVTVMPSGATVELRGEPQGEFYPVGYNGATGWAHGNWISAGSAAPDPDPDPDPAPGGDGSVPVGDSVTGSATVTANLNMRQGPSTEYDVVTVMRNGITVELRGDPQGAFYPVASNGLTGWAHGDWLDIGNDDPAPDPDPDEDPDPNDGSVPVGDTSTGMAVTTASLNLREGPGLDYAVTRVIPQTATVELRGDPQNAYYPVVFDGTPGWAHGDWLNMGGSDPDPAPGSGDGNDSGDGSTPQYLYTSAAQNLRAEPTTASESVWMIPPGTRVTVTGAPQNGWYPVSWAHVSGWMYGEYLLTSYTREVPEDQQWIVDIIYAAADRYGQPREDMLRVAQCESHLDPNAVNPTSGTSGLFQFRPSTWATTPYADQDIFDPTANANAAGWMWSVGRRNEWACQ